MTKCLCYGESCSYKITIIHVLPLFNVNVLLDTVEVFFKSLAHKKSLMVKQVSARSFVQRFFSLCSSNSNNSKGAKQHSSSRLDPVHDRPIEEDVTSVQQPQGGGKFVISPIISLFRSSFHWI